MHLAGRTSSSTMVFGSAAEAEAEDSAIADRCASARSWSPLTAEISAVQAMIAGRRKSPATCPDRAGPSISLSIDRARRCSAAWWRAIAVRSLMTERARTLRTIGAAVIPTEAASTWRPASASPIIERIAMRLSPRWSQRPTSSAMLSTESTPAPVPGKRERSSPGPVCATAAARSPSALEASALEAMSSASVPKNSSPGPVARALGGRRRNAVQDERGAGRNIGRPTAPPVRGGRADAFAPRPGCPCPGRQAAGRRAGRTGSEQKRRHPHRLGDPQQLRPVPSAPGQEQDIAEEFGLENPRRLHVLDEHIEQRSDDRTGTGGGVEVAAELGGQKRRDLQQRAADLVLDDGDHPAGTQPVDHSLGVADAEPAEEVVGDGGQSLQRGRLGHGAELGENRCRRLVAGAERQRHTWTQFDDPIGEGRRIRIDGDP